MLDSIIIVKKANINLESCPNQLYLGEIRETDYWYIICTIYRL